MATLDTLPDLVIINILRYFQPISFRIQMNTEYCAISSRWRQLALPIVYKKLFIYGPHFDPDEPDKINWITNIDIYKTERLQKLVKKIKINIYNVVVDFALLLGSLLDRINGGSVGWPKEYGLQLTGEIRRSDILGSTYVHQSLNNGLLDRMRHALERFACKFPNVSCLRVTMQQSRGTAQQFTGQLLDTFNPRVQDVYLYLEFPMSLGYYSPELKRLYYKFTKNTKYPLPKIRNPQKLECWRMNNTFNNVSWSDLVDIPADGSPVVFSNLKTLSFEFLDNTWFDLRYGRNNYELPTRKTPIHDIQLQFPWLTNLTLSKENVQNELLFTPQAISSSLEKVKLKISLEDLVHFRKLPITSIGKLEFYLHMCEITDMKEFYRVTNRLLGEIDNFGRYTGFVLDGRFDRVDIERIRWTNITELKLTFVDASTLVDLLSKLPLIKSIIMDRLIYSSSYNSARKDKSQLKEVHISQLKGNDWTLENTASFISYLISQHPNTNSLILPVYLKNRIKEMFQGTQWQHVEIISSLGSSVSLNCGCERYDEHEDIH